MSAPPHRNGTKTITSPSSPTCSAPVISRKRSLLQILQSLAASETTMPLWGASFDRDIARHYGDRFTFILHGPFPAVPAWIYSGIVAEELELVCGGRYEIIEPTDLTTEKIEVHLQFLQLPPLTRHSTNNEPS